MMNRIVRQIVPKPIKKSLKSRYRRWKAPKWRGNERIFCISFQRTGTTSFGDFFENFGFPRANSKISTLNDWSKLLYDGNYDAIFSSLDFKRYQVFEDNPWWAPGFYKIIHKKYPNSKFILLNRDSRSWFKSMKKHSNGKTLGNTKRHARIYNREKEFYERLQHDPNFKPTDGNDNLLDLEGMDEHYITIYENHIKDAKEYFDNVSPNSLLVVDLEDKQKWLKIAEFVGFEIPINFDIHSNKSQ